MELIFCRQRDLCVRENNDFYVIGRENCCGFPPIPITVFNSVPQNRPILYKIFSCDCLLRENGEFSTRLLSETKALELAGGAPVYEDGLSGSCYFRFGDEGLQHTVWLEDFAHTARKLFMLKRLGVTTVFVPLDENSAPTASRLFSAYGNRI